MKALVDMEPRWVTQDGQRVGLSFACPSCAPAPAESVHGGRVAVFFDPPLDPGPPSPVPSWKRTGDTFETITLAPSIRVQTGPGPQEHWHGFVTNGQVTP